MTVVSATLLIPSVLIFHFFLAALYLAQSSRHPSCFHPLLLLCIVPSLPLLACLGELIRSSSLSPAVTLAPRSLRCQTIGLARVTVSRGALASRLRWQAAAERVEPDRPSNLTSCSPLINATGRLVGWHAACHSNCTGVAWITKLLYSIGRPARWY